MRLVSLLVIQKDTKIDILGEYITLVSVFEKLRSYVIGENIHDDNSYL